MGYTCASRAQPTMYLLHRMSGHVGHCTDHVDDLDQDTSREVCRKALLLPTTHAQHVGRLVVKPGCGTSTGESAAVDTCCMDHAVHDTMPLLH